jgi:hypothetical protein
VRMEMYLNLDLIVCFSREYRLYGQYQVVEVVILKNSVAELAALLIGHQCKSAVKKGCAVLLANC